MFNPHLPSVLSDSLTKEQMKSAYADLHSNMYDALSNLSTGTMWESYSMNFELLNLYRILYTANGDIKNLKAVDECDRRLKAIEILLAEIKTGLGF